MEKSPSDHEQVMLKTKEGVKTASAGKHVAGSSQRPASVIGSHGVIDLILLVKVGTGEEQGAAGTGWSQWPGPL
jgi:hypothetical protein